MTPKQFDIMSPVTLPNGNTMWTKVGKAFSGDSSRNRYDVKLSIMSLPIRTFTGDILELFLFEKQANRYADKGKKASEHVDGGDNGEYGETENCPEFDDKNDGPVF